MRIRVFPPPFSDFSAVDESGFIELPEGTTVGEALGALGVPFRTFAVALCAVNRRKTALDSVLRDGDVLSFHLLVPGG